MSLVILALWKGAGQRHWSDREEEKEKGRCCRVLGKEEARGGGGGGSAFDFWGALQQLRLAGGVPGAPDSTRGRL